MGTEIISADSRQCYRELRIGVARPTDAEREAVPHHFIANHTIHEPITAAGFAKEASQYVHFILEQHDHVIVCGGTGLYIKALVEGLDAIPEVPSEIREQVVQLYTEKGIDSLRTELQTRDTRSGDYIDLHNPQRMMRALEVILHTGEPIHAFQQNSTSPLVFNGDPVELEYRILHPEREELYQSINERVDRMMQEGLEQEVRDLYPYRQLSPLQTVGYQELFDYLDGKCTHEEAVEKIKQHTRNYAKRQITWFKRVQ